MYLAVEVLRKREAVGPPVAGAMVPDLQPIYAYLFSRVGNRADAEDLTQEVALKAVPRLRRGAPEPAVRSYLYATARSVLAMYWTRRLRLPEAELPYDVRADASGEEVVPSPENAARITEILARLTPDHRRLLELRFLQGCSLREVASQMGKTVGSVKVMQLRALRKAAEVAPGPRDYAAIPRASQSVT